MNVENCPRCGRVFAKNFRDICPACIKDIDNQYETVYKYLKEHRGCTIQELSEATEVSVKQITRFIREGRISIRSAPNMGYPCEVCGTSIREHAMCESCRLRLAKDVQNSDEDRQRAEALRIKENQMSFNIKDRLQDRFR